MMIEFSSFGKIHRKRAESRSKCDLRGGVGKIKTTPQKATPQYLGQGKSEGRPDSQTLELAGGRIIMHAIYRGQSRVNERDRTQKLRYTERELSVVLNRFQNLLLKSIISRGWCMCGVRGQQRVQVFVHTGPS